MLAKATSAKKSPLHNTTDRAVTDINDCFKANSAQASTSADNYRLNKTGDNAPPPPPFWPSARTNGFAAGVFTGGA
jgi:hypothetical protein